jgi:uncharacterized repeat protein (TIGR01451 family)
MKKTSVATLLLIATYCTATQAWAEDDSPVTLTLSVLKEVVTKQDDGSKHIDYIEPSIVVPGDVVVYNTEYNNRGEQTLQEVAIVNPVAEHTTYVSDSATGLNTSITYSVNNGEDFGQPQTLMITDSNGKRRLANNQDYTHIRWVVDSVAPGVNGSVSFKVKVD